VIDTWVTDTGATAEDQMAWTGPRGGYERMVGAQETGNLKTLPAQFLFPHANNFTPPRYGAEGDWGGQGRIRNSHHRGAGGAWWSGGSDDIIDVGVLVSSHRPARKEMEKLAATIVPALGF
jgi:hypothetical protein